MMREILISFTIIPNPTENWNGEKASIQHNVRQARHNPFKHKEININTLNSL